MLVGLFLHWPVMLFEMAVEGLASALRMVSISTSGIWPSKGDSGIGGLFSQGRAIPKSEAHQYDMGYEAAASIAKCRSLPVLHEALRQFLPKVKSEYEWGVADALADEIQKRNG